MRLKHLIAMPAVLMGFLIIVSSCNTLRWNAPVQKQFISGMVDGKEEFYKYNASGIYDLTQNKITLKASDTTTEVSKLWAINIELGSDQKLSDLKFPRVFSYESDPTQRQKVFANVFWDNNDKQVLYDNYTWRRNSDLVVTIESYKKNALKGRFSGTLVRGGGEMKVLQGYFYVVLFEK